MEEINIAPFYVGQKVVGVNTPEGSVIKDGQAYVISDCHYSVCFNPISKGASFWYVGVVGNDNKWMTPKLFAPVDEKFQSISIEKIIEKETPLVGAN